MAMTFAVSKMPSDEVNHYFTDSVALCAGVSAQTVVTLTVDMSGEEVSTEGVHVAGAFQWTMSDNGDGTWSYTFTIDIAAIYQYKFINGNAWGNDEIVLQLMAID